MDTEKEYSYRSGKGIRWQSVNKTCMGESIATGYTVDNLDTKRPEEAENKFELLFITIRKTLENHESRCLDDENDRLNVCQELANVISSERKNLFDWETKYEIS